MLYNPNWGKIYTIENFYLWLKTKPKNEIYDYTNAFNCAVAQYLQAQGIDDANKYFLDPESLRKYGWHDIVFNVEEKDTFGAAMRRAWVARISPNLLSLLRVFRIM